MTILRLNRPLHWYLEPTIVLLASLLAPLALLGHPPTFDELYHLLAARSWAADGTLEIAQGNYNRDAFLTVSIGVLFRTFGESLIVARVPSLLSGGLLVTGVFLWTREVVDRPSAWTAALLLAISPLGLFLSGFIRAYATHALLFFLGTVSFYSVATRRGSKLRASALTAVSALLFACATFIQRTTLIGLAGLAFWFVLTKLPPLPAADKDAQRPRRASLWILGAGALAAAGYAFVEFTAIGQSIVQRYTATAEWSAGRDLRFYHWVLLEKYPTLWTLIPLGAVLAVSNRRSLGILCSSIVAVGLTAHAFAGMKAERYIFYLMPYFFMLWSLALKEALPFLRRAIAEGAESLLGLSERPEPRVRGIVGATGLATLLFFLASNPAFPMALQMIGGKVAYSEIDTPFRQAASADWESAHRELKPWLDAANVIVTTNGLRTLYEFSNYDIEFSATRLSDYNAREFATDPRTGKPMISTAESLRQVLLCYPTGLFLSPDRPLEAADEAVVQVLENHARRLQLPDKSGLQAFVWKREYSIGQDDGCAGLPGPTDGK